MSEVSDLNAFDEFLKPGVFVQDIDALFPLLQSAHIIDVLIGLFRGGARGGHDSPGGDARDCRPGRVT